MFTCTLVSPVTVSPLRLRTLLQGPWVSSKSVFSHRSSYGVAPIAHCALNPQQLSTTRCTTLKQQHQFRFLNATDRAREFKAGVSRQSNLASTDLEAPSVGTNEGKTENGTMMDEDANL